MTDSIKIVVSKYRELISTFVFKGFVAEELFFESSFPYRVGDIYIGRVSNVKKNIGACFVDIAKDVTCYLSFDDIYPEGLINRPFVNELKQNDLVCVQIKREPLKTKPAAVTMKLSLTGIYSVVTLDDQDIHYSSKLSKAFTDELSTVLTKDSFSHGFVVRTSALKAELSDVVNEAKALCGTLDDIVTNMKFRTLYSSLFRVKPSYYERIKGKLTDENVEIITDSKEVFDVLSGLPNVSLYTDEKLSLKSLYGFDKVFHDATDKTVLLPTGGSLVIEPTEAMTVIDVNSGKITGKKDKSTIDRMTNLAAAKEIGRQIRLRNLSGIIIIDFINASKPSDMEPVVLALKEALASDSLKAKFIDVTKLSLVEITREKRYASIYDEINKM